MSDRLLRFCAVVAGRDVRGHVQVYYGDYYVGCISPAGTRWRAWLHGIALGDFDESVQARRAVAQWYYGPCARESSSRRPSVR